LDVLSLERETAIPPVGAGPESVTEPADVEPPTTAEGVICTPVNVGADTVSVAVLVVDESVPLIVAVTADATAVVETENVAVVFPEATVTEAGTVTPLEVLLLVSVTDVPLVGAELVSVTVPVELVPPVTVVGLKVTLESDGAVALTVNDAVLEVEPRVEVMVADS